MISRKVARPARTISERKLDIAAATCALAQRVEVADDEVRIMGSKSGLLRTLVAASSVEMASFGVQSSVLKWRTRHDSNV